AARRRCAGAARRAPAASPAAPAAAQPGAARVPARRARRAAAGCGWRRGTHRFLRLCRACLSPSSRFARPSCKDSPLTTSLTSGVHATDDSQARLDHLEAIAARLLERCRAAGATQAEVSCTEGRGINVGVRMGSVGMVKPTRDRGIDVTVYYGQRKGSASTADLREESLEASVAQACAIAGFTEDDPAAGLADAALMATDLREFDSWHPWALDADRAIDLALACETAGRDSDARIGNSDGASIGSGQSLSVYANSHGFVGRDRDTRHRIRCALIGGQGEAMQRDGWYSLALAEADLGSPAAIGRHAARRALARLAPRQVPTGEYPVLFSSEMARSLVGHLLGAVSGGALYRRASFLVDSAGTQLFPGW